MMMVDMQFLLHLRHKNTADSLYPQIIFGHPPIRGAEALFYH